MTCVTWIAIASACRGDDSPSPSTAPPSPSTPPTAPAASKDGIEVVSRGATPQQVLRYQLTKGIKTQIELEVDLDADMRSKQRKMPTFITVMDVSADEILPNGDAKVRTTIVRGTVRARPDATDLEAVAAQAGLMAGVELTGTLTPSGRMQSPKLASGDKELPAAARAQIEQTLVRSAEIAMPLPDVAVGVGAKWRHHKSLVIESVAMEMVTEIEITAIDGPRISFALRATVTGRPQTVELEGTRIEISNVRGGGDGKGVLDLARMIVTGDQKLEFGFDLKTPDVVDTMKLRVAKRMRAT